MKNLCTLTMLLLIMLLHVSLSFAQGVPPREEVNLDDVYAPYNLSVKNAVVVVIDRGIDDCYPDFLDEIGNTHLACVYDMLDPTGLGDPYDIGTFFMLSEIDEALDNNDLPLSTYRGGHGSATTGIIAGDGSDTAGLQFQGVAPNATINRIKVTHDAFPPFGNQQGQAGFFDPSYLPIALQFTHDKITELGLPSSERFPLKTWLWNAVTFHPIQIMDNFPFSWERYATRSRSVSMIFRANASAKTHRNTRVIQEEVPFARGISFVSVPGDGASLTFKIIKK